MFPERMRALRLGKKLTLNELAQGLNQMQARYIKKAKTATQLSKWECGINTPSYLDVRQLAEFFGVSADYLLGRGYENFDLAEILASNAEVEFAAKKLTASEKSELYALIKGFLYGREEQAKNKKTAIQLELGDLDE